MFQARKGAGYRRMRHGRTEVGAFVEHGGQDPGESIAGAGGVDRRNRRR
jgi:hypothetical protein